MYTTQAWDILTAFYPQDSTTGSFKTSKEPDKAGRQFETWHRRQSAHASPTPRDAAYLAAYVEICRKCPRWGRDGVKRVQSWGGPLAGFGTWLQDRRTGRWARRQPHPSQSAK